MISIYTFMDIGLEAHICYGLLIVYTINIHSQKLEMRSKVSI